MIEAAANIILIFDDGCFHCPRCFDEKIAGVLNDRRRWNLCSCFFLVRVSQCLLLNDVVGSIHLRPEQGIPVLGLVFQGGGNGLNGDLL